MIITATASKKALLKYDSTVTSKLIIALGADEEGKQELDTQFLMNADRVIADDPNQCCKIGELQHTPLRRKILSLGDLLRNPIKPSLGLTVVDLTGLAIQDNQIVKAIQFKHDK